MRDPIATLKNAARVAFARGLAAVADAQDATQSSGVRALHTLGLPARSDIDRLQEAVADLGRLTESLRARL